jgi:cellulose synthase (UDP-forming)
VYTPDVIAVGDGPTSFTDFFNQQKRWAWGCWQVILQHSPRMLRQMSWSQRLSFLLLQPYYPSVAVSWILSVLLTSAYMISRVSLHLPIDRWALLWGASIGSNFLTFLWLRRFNLTQHERQEWGARGAARRRSWRGVLRVPRHDDRRRADEEGPGRGAGCHRH